MITVTVTDYGYKLLIIQSIGGAHSYEPLGSYIYVNFSHDLMVKTKGS